MILVDTSVIVPWLDQSHPNHHQCWQALRLYAPHERLAISSVTYADLPPALELAKPLTRF